MSAANPPIPSQPPPALAGDLDASVDQLLREVDPNAPGDPGLEPAAPPAELIGPGGVVVARVEHGGAVRDDRELTGAGKKGAAANSIMDQVRDELDAPTRSMAVAPVGARNANSTEPPATLVVAPATIEELDQALAGRASAAMAEEPAQPPPLARAVAANPPGTPPAAPPLNPTAVAIPQVDREPEPAAEAPPSAAITPARPVRPARASLLAGLLSPLAAKTERLSASSRQTLRWAAYVTFVSAAAVWTIVLIRSPESQPAQGEPAEASAAEPETTTKTAENHAAPKSSSRSATHEKPGGKTASADEHH